MARSDPFRHRGYYAQYIPICRESIEEGETNSDCLSSVCDKYMSRYTVDNGWRS